VGQQARAKGINVAHGIIARPPSIRMIAKVRALRQTGSKVESINVNFQAELAGGNVGKFLKRQQTCAAGNSKLDHRNGLQTEPVRLLRRKEHTGSVLRTGQCLPSHFCLQRAGKEAGCGFGQQAKWRLS
jgi:hypothetical protein